MTRGQGDLLLRARDSLEAARILQSSGYPGFAASRAYYAMFYVAEALLLGKGLSFSKHSAVHAAFGEHFAKPGLVPIEFHQNLLRAMEARHAGDYGYGGVVTAEQSALQIKRAEEFLRLAERLIGPIPTQGDDKV
jgi:uncharacterized protein (UPF0332 family)